MQQCLTMGSLLILNNLGLTATQMADASVIVEQLKEYTREQVNESV